MAFELRNFVIDRVRRGIMLSSADGSMLWQVNQITNPSLSISTDTVDAVDALGTPIMSFNRGKTAEFSAENSLFDMGLLAAQSGKAIEYATADASYSVPYMDEIKVSAANVSSNTLTLTHTPIAGTLTVLCELNGDGTMGKKYTVGTGTATGTTVSVNGATVTFASGALKAGARYFAFYDYTATGATNNGAAQVVNTAAEFPTAGRFVMEVLGVDVCDPTTLYSAYIELPNSKLLADFDLSFATDSTHPFTIRAMQDYCDPENRLFRIVIPETATVG